MILTTSSNANLPDGANQRRLQCLHSHAYGTLTLPRSPTSVTLGTSILMPMALVHLCPSRRLRCLHSHAYSTLTFTLTKTHPGPRWISVPSLVPIGPAI